MSALGLQRRRFESHLRDALPGLRGRMRVASLGTNGAAYRIRFDDRSLLLRLEPAADPGPAAGKLLSLPVAPAPGLRRERRILDALAANGVPAPKPVLVCDDPLVAGAPFFVAAIPEGRVFAGYGLSELEPERRRGVYFALAETLARLHRIDWAAAGLADYARPAHFFAHEVARGNRRLGVPDACGAVQPGLARVGDWLAAHLPHDDESAIHHGDFRLGNLIFDPAGSRVLALCGWEHAALGHPLADAAHSCMPWQLDRTAAGLRDLDLARQRIPTQAEYLTHYRQCGGHAERVTTFHLVFALFRAVLAPPGGDERNGAALARRALELIDGAGA
ncbi:phosphotransferase family protein [Pseudoduganella sp. LjRoot289]|uniref:phosphotransferase family protein n=1 Tax=Pseudoduganella sp. LjRoot289 TaxID=3342314 RepID=UPI003ECC48E8